MRKLIFWLIIDNSPNTFVPLCAKAELVQALQTEFSVFEYTQKQKEYSDGSYHSAGQFQT